MLVPITLLMEPIQIRTTTSPGSNELLSMLLYTFTSKISVRFTDPMQYWVTSCTDDWVDFTCDEVAGDIRIWTISTDIDTSVKITCNDKVVVDFDERFEDEDSHGTCKLSEWFSDNHEDKFWIDTETTVSDYSLKAGMFKN